MAMNLYDPPKGAFWGEFNDRPLNQDHVATLVRDFGARLDNCEDKTALDAAVKREWVKNIENAIETADGTTINDVPLMELTEEGLSMIEPNNLWILGGNHRRMALIQHVADLKKALADTVANLDKIEVERKELEGDIAGKLDQEVERLTEKTKVLGKRIESSCKWVIRLYDRGKHTGSRTLATESIYDDDAVGKVEENGEKLSNAIFRFLSRNEIRGVYMATDEEHLQEDVYVLKDAIELDLKSLKDRDRGNEEDPTILYRNFMKVVKEKEEEYRDKELSGYKRLFCVPSFALGLVMASRIRRHYTHSSWFKISALNQMLKVHGAVCQC
jgi:hypothetical protein